MLVEEWDLTLALLNNLQLCYNPGDGKLATTTKLARQLITHKKVFVGDGIVNIPSYVVPVELEEKISLKIKKKSGVEKVMKIKK